MSKDVVGLLSTPGKKHNSIKEALIFVNYDIIEYESLTNVVLNPPDLLIINEHNEDIVYEWIKFLRKNPIFEDIPIILVTSSAEEDLMMSAFQLGINDFIVLPANSLEVISKVATHLELKKSKIRIKQLYEELTESLKIASLTQHVTIPPNLYVTDKYWFTSIYQPVQFIGGDVFDIIPLDDGSVCFYMADVSGHGIAPAMLTFAVKTLIESIVKKERKLYEIANQLQESLRSVMKENYLTIFLGILKDSICEYINCGHPNIIVYDGNRFSEKITKNNLPIGLFEYQYTSDDVSFFEIDFNKAYVVYTDGVYAGYEKKRDTKLTAVEMFLKYLNTNLTSYCGEIIPFKINREIKKIFRVIEDDYSIMTFGNLGDTYFYLNNNEVKQRGFDTLLEKIKQLTLKYSIDETQLLIVRKPSEVLMISKNLETGYILKHLGTSISYQAENFMITRIFE